MDQNDMPRATRYAIQFADGTFARNCSGRRTHKTAELARKYIAGYARGLVKSEASYANEVKRGRMTQESAERHLVTYRAVAAAYAAAQVVPV